MLPQDFLDRMQQMLGEHYPAFLESYDRDRYQSLRINPLKAERREFLVKAPFTLTQVPWSADGFYYDSADAPGKHPYHEAGVYYIQEPSAMAPAEYLIRECVRKRNPHNCDTAGGGQNIADSTAGMKQEPCSSMGGERILDLCAAPGGKSTQIAAAMRGQGILVCNEIHPGRAKILSENVERMGIRNAVVTNETPERLAEYFPAYFTRILVDAPCSGEGMFRKNADAVSEWSQKNVALCAKRQDGILDCAAKMLSPGGTLVYSTCTFAPEENEGSIYRFLCRHPGFSIEEVPLSPGMSRGVPAWATSAQPDEERTAGEAAHAVQQDEERAAGEAAHAVQPDGERAAGEAAHSVQTEALAQTVRLWPHRVKGEGHYLAVLHMAGECSGVQRGYGVENGIPERDFMIPGKGISEYLEFLKHTFSPDCAARMHTPGTRYLRFGDQLYKIMDEMPPVRGLKVLRPGLHLGTVKKGRFVPSHALALTSSAMDVLHTLNLAADSGELKCYLNGATFPAEGEKGWYLITADGFSVGWGKLAGGMMKNHYPKGLRKHLP